MSIDIKELLDEEELDPKKLFNEEEYSTLIINREGFSKKQNTHADLIEGLLDKEVTREQSEEIFGKLKDANAHKLLVDSIKSAERTEEKAKLTAACWESGLDFSDYFLFFVELTCTNDFQLALEGLTVVESCEGKLDDAILAQALNIAETTKSTNEDLMFDLRESIRQRMHH